MRRRPAALALLLLAALPACERARFGGGPPNVVVIAADTLRADALEPYGGPIPTPAFTQLADEGVLFEDTYAPTPESGPSQATLLTGLRVLRHGVTFEGAGLSRENLTLPELFRDGGYTTAAFLSSGSLPARLGFDQGFGVYQTSSPERRAADTTLAAAHWLTDAPQPFFLFVHYVDPRRPYTEPRGFARRVRQVDFDLSHRRVTGLSPDALLGLARAYHAEVMVLDDALGQLLAAIDARDRREGRSTLVVATALHGEALGEHGALAEGASLYQEQLHVPLLFRWRGRLPAGIRLQTPLSLRVVAPTVAELAFVQFPSGQTRSVATELRAGREPEARPVFAQRGPLTPDRVAPSTEEAVEELAVRRGRWKLIRDADGRGRLYDLESDPDELRDVAAEQPAVSGELDALLDQLMARNPPRFAGHRPAAIDAER